MNICVFGLWHLGSVTAACLADLGFRVTGLDPDPVRIRDLNNGRPPLYEPGLENLLRAGNKSNNLRFTTDPLEALRNADVVWVTDDTPVDGQDRADVAFVEQRLTGLFPHLPPGAAVLISSQVPVGFTRRMENLFAGACPGKFASFAYLPENLRLGRAIDSFRRPGRIVAGTRRNGDRELLYPLLSRICDRIIWMTVESAEMTKHAINAFLAASIAFANELALLCEKTGADAGEVEQGLKSEERIGHRAYLSPGAAFAGGTLARDLAYLANTGRSAGRPAILMEAVQSSNESHKGWPGRKILEFLGSPAGQKIAVLGLTYKPDTDTLRRSEAVELCRWLVRQGALVNAHDPAIKELPGQTALDITLCPDPEQALTGASCAVVATAWPVFQTLRPDVLCRVMSRPVVVDMQGFLHSQLGHDHRVKYFSVGRSSP